MRFAVILLLAVLLCVPPPAAARANVRAEARIALVIGNADYKDSPLINPVNDAKAVAASLRATGFEVIERHNQSAIEMRRSIREFGEKLRGKDAGLFYFAGHGVQINGRNFLIPAKADIKYEDEIEDQSVDVMLVLSKMESAKNRINLVILDACRNNPFARGSRSAQAGLAAMEAPIGSLIAYATSPGQVASDGTGKNGLYTQYLVQEIERPGLKVEDVFKRVRAAVRQASAGRQIPWENTSLEGDFYFRYPERAEPDKAAQDGRRQQEDEIQRAVAAALSRSREEADREKKRLEAFYAEKLETEREAMRKEALERIAALEVAAQQRLAAVTPAASAPPVAAAAQTATAPATDARPAGTAADPPPERLGLAQGDEKSPPSFMLALGLDVLDSKPKPVSEQVMRGLAPARPAVGDKWVYYRTMRDGEGLSRRNYLTMEVSHASETGHTVQINNSDVPMRFDAAGNQFSAPLPSGSGAIVFDPIDPLYQFPLEPGKTWSQRSKETLPGMVREADNTVTVVGWDSVQVPAGTFTALKISQVSNRAWEPFPGQQLRSKRVSNVWYVPAVRGFARYETLEVSNTGNVLLDQAWELDSFQLR